MRHFLLSSALALLAVPSLSAQIPANITPVPLGAAPVHAGVYDVASGVFTPGQQPPPPPGSAVIYDNSAFGGSYFPSGPGLLNMDWGTLSAGGMNDIVSFDMGYATSDTNPVDITVYLHEAATGFGDAGTTITQIPISGLPGSASGSPEAFVVTINLSSPVKVLDGGIGYSYEMFDSVTGPLLVGPPNEAGVIDAFDQYTSALGYVGTFFFGGAPLASFYFAATGVEPECFLVFGGGLGGDTFTPGNFAFSTGLSGIVESHPVTMEDYPSFTLPKRGAVAVGGTLGGGGTTAGHSKVPAFINPDGSFSVQVMMWNPVDAPNDPEQYSAVLFGQILPDGSIWTRAVGSGSIEIGIDTTTNSKGETVFSFPFQVPGF